MVASGIIEPSHTTTTAMPSTPYSRAPACREDHERQPLTNVLVQWADDRSPNLGVRVLGTGTETLARRAWPGARFTFYNYGARPAPGRVGGGRGRRRGA